MVAMAMTRCRYLFDKYLTEETWYSQAYQAVSHLLAEVALWATCAHQCLSSICHLLLAEEFMSLSKPVPSPAR